MNDPKFQDEAVNAVGRAMLHHFSPRGGSYGPGIDDQRAEQIATLLRAGEMSGAELHGLFCKIAEMAGTEFQRFYDGKHWDLFRRFETAAVRADSLSLHRFVEDERRKLE